MPEIPHALNTRFSPSFLILKAAIFSRTGTLKMVGEPKDWQKLCEKNYSLTAWITHRLKKNDTLSNEVAEKLAANLNEKIGSSCFRQVEIDLEPLTGEEPWLEAFLKKLKSQLKPELKLRVALPFLAEEPTVGTHWKKEFAQKILPAVDGMDFMVYDTGSKTLQDYLKLVDYNLKEANRLLTGPIEKTILLGIPAYHDRTPLHRDVIENVSAFFAALKALKLAEVSKICSGQILLSLYAGWTLSPEDRKNIEEMKSWLMEACKKDS